MHLPPRVGRKSWINHWDCCLFLCDPCCFYVVLCRMRTRRVRFSLEQKKRVLTSQKVFHRGRGNQAIVLRSARQTDISILHQTQKMTAHSGWILFKLSFSYQCRRKIKVVCFVPKMLEVTDLIIHFYSEAWGLEF